MTLEDLDRASPSCARPPSGSARNLLELELDGARAARRGCPRGRERRRAGRRSSAALLEHGRRTRQLRRSARARRRCGRARRRPPIGWPSSRSCCAGLDRPLHGPVPIGERALLAPRAAPIAARRASCWPGWARVRRGQRDARRARRRGRLAPRLRPPGRAARGDGARRRRRARRAGVRDAPPAELSARLAAGPARGGARRRSAALEASLAAIAGEARGRRRAAREASRSIARGAGAHAGVEAARATARRWRTRARARPRSRTRRARAAVDGCRSWPTGCARSVARERGRPLARGARRAGALDRRARTPRSSARARHRRRQPRARSRAQPAARPARGLPGARRAACELLEDPEIVELSDGRAQRGSVRRPTDLGAGRQLVAATSRRSPDTTSEVAAMTCGRRAAPGTIVDGYCDVCGMAPAAQLGGAGARSTATAVDPHVGSATTQRAPAVDEPLVGHACAAGLGAGLVDVPAVPYRDPSDGDHGQEPRSPRTGGSARRCGEPVGRGRDGAAGPRRGLLPQVRRTVLVRAEARARATSSPASTRSSAASPTAGWAGSTWRATATCPTAGWCSRACSTPATTTRWRPRSPSAASWPRSSTRTSSRSSTSSSTSSSGYIVMEYVGGQSLQGAAHRRGGDNGERAGAAARRRRRSPTCSRSCRRSGTCTASGLLFCDFKPDNVIQTQDSLKLIDLGGVYRMDDAGEPGLRHGRLPGARDRHDSGPTVPSDLYTVGAHARGAVHRLPGLPGHVPVHAAAARQRCRSSPSTTRSTAFLLKGDRAGSRRPLPVGRGDGRPARRRPARGRRAPRRARPRPGRARCSRGDLRARLDRSRLARCLPALQVDSDDPAAGYLATLAAHRPGRARPRCCARAPERTVEVELRLARALIEPATGRGRRAARRRSTANDPWEWRVEWYRGHRRAGPRPPAGRGAVLPRASTSAVPGELAPKLALGASRPRPRGDPRRGAPRGTTIVVAHRPARSPRRPSGWPAAASRSATGPARSRPTTAIPEQLERLHRGADRRRIRCLTDGRRRGRAAPSPTSSRPTRSLQAACTLDREQRARLTAELLEAALGTLDGPPDAPARRMCASPAARSSSATCASGWRATYRELARMRADQRASASGSSTAPTTCARGRGHDAETTALRCDVPCAALLAGDRFCEECGARAWATTPSRATAAMSTYAGRGCERRTSVDVAAAVSDRGRVHRRNEDAFHLELVAGRGRRGRLRRHLHRRRPATPRRAPAARRSRATALVAARCRERRRRSSRRRRSPPIAAAHAAVGARARGHASHRLAVPVVHAGLRRLPRGRDRDRLGRRQPRVLDRRDDARQLTVDDSWAGEQVAAGLLSRDEAARDPRAHAITRWLGRRRPGGPPQFVVARPPEPGRLILCTRRAVELHAPIRGRSSAPARRRCRAECSPAPSRARSTDTALARGGHDNITVAVVDLRPADGGRQTMTTFTAETYQNEYLAVGGPRSTRSSPSRVGRRAARPPSRCRRGRDRDRRHVRIDGHAPRARCSAAKQATTAAAIDCIRDGVLFARRSPAPTPRALDLSRAGPLAVAGVGHRAGRAADRDRGAAGAGAARRSARGSRWPTELFAGARGDPPRDPAHRRPEPARDAPSSSTRRSSAARGASSATAGASGRTGRSRELRQIASALLGTRRHRRRARGPGRRLHRDDRAPRWAKDDRRRRAAPVDAAGGARWRFVKQVAPTIEDLTDRGRPVDALTADYPTGRVGRRVARLPRLHPASRRATVGDEMLAGRVSLVVDGEVVSQALIRAVWTDDAAALDAHQPRGRPLHRAEPSWPRRSRRASRRARPATRTTATFKLGRAVQLAAESGNDGTKLEAAARRSSTIEDAAHRDVRLKREVDDADEMALDTRSTKTRAGEAEAHDRDLSERPRLGDRRLLRSVRRADRRPDEQPRRPRRSRGAPARPRARPAARPAAPAIASARPAATTSRRPRRWTSPPAGSS